MAIDHIREVTSLHTGAECVCGVLRYTTNVNIFNSAKREEINTSEILNHLIAT